MPLLQLETQSAGEVAFSRDASGHVAAVHLQPGEGIMVREHQFLAATNAIQYDYARIKGFANMFYGGGPVRGPLPAGDQEGVVWIHGYGNLFEKELEPARSSMSIRCGCTATTRCRCTRRSWVSRPGFLAGGGASSCSTASPARAGSASRACTTARRWLRVPSPGWIADGRGPKILGGLLGGLGGRRDDRIRGRRRGGRARLSVRLPRGQSAPERDPRRARDWWLPTPRGCQGSAPAGSGATSSCLWLRIQIRTCLRRGRFQISLHQPKLRDESEAAAFTQLAATLSYLRLSGYRLILERSGILADEYKPPGPCHRRGHDGHPGQASRPAPRRHQRSAPLAQAKSLPQAGLPPEHRATRSSSARSSWRLRSATETVSGEQAVTLADRALALSQADSSLDPAGALRAAKEQGPLGA